MKEYETPADDEYEGLQDIPNADAIMENTPIDPAAPDSDIMHGIDLLNGYDGEDTE